jgi:autotransporter-associated beta strand protein
MKSLLFLLALAATALAQNPLGLTAGVAADKVLGNLAVPANFNTSSHSGNIGYSSAALSSRNFNVRLPSGYDANNPSKRYGLVSFIDVGDAPVFPTAYAAALDAYDLIWIAPQGCGNNTATTERSGAAIMGVFRMTELYNIEPTRIYASGLSGGSRVSSEMTYLRNDFFRGFIGRVGAALPEIIPDFSVGGNLTDAATYNDEDGDYEYFYAWEWDNGSSPNTETYVILPPYFRTALISQYSDFRRAELLGIYRYGHLNHGNTARMILRPGGHSDTNGPSFREALDLIYHPLVDVVWDRFENNFLPANVQSGKTVAGSGFTTLSGTVAETTYSYNSATHGVLKLTGTGAAAESNDTFTWQNPFGILVDARLRAENATTPGQNQQIGLHIIPATATGTPADQAGFHLYWCYGAPYRAEIVSAQGTRKTLATWEHSATHPMNLASTDKTFWNSNVAPDYAAKTKSFRGEDVRLSLNSAGFQLTFNRPAANLTTNYPDKVVTATNVATIDDPAPLPNESLPFLIQGFWNEVESTLVNGLPAGDWRVVLSNNALVAEQSCGNAVVDELRVVASTGQQAAPATLAVTAPQNTTRSLIWAQIHGAMGYAIERATSPDGPFTALATASNTKSTYSDTVPSNIAYYYRVAAVGSDGATGKWSPVAFAKRNPSLPAAPTSPAVTYPAAYQARVAWTDAANNETGYRVERSLAGFAQWSLVSGLLPSGSTFFLDTTAVAGASYDYRISAINADGLSNYASVAASVPDAAPPAPTGLAGNATYASVNLTWDAVPQAASYRVKRSDTPGGPYTTIASSLTIAAYPDTTFTPGTTHYYVVSAVSGSGLLEADSAEISATALLLLPPTGLSVTPGYTVNSLAWSAATGADSYQILRATDAAGQFETIASGITGTAWQDSGLVTGTAYFYQLRSVSGTILSAPTTAASGTPVPGVSIKANNTTALDQAASWTNGIVPTVLDTARWDGTYASGAASVGTGLAVKKLQIASPSAAVSLTTGTGTLTLGADGVDMSAASQSLTVFAPVVLAASQTWNVAASRILQCNAAVSDGGAGRGLSVAGAASSAAVVLAADNTYTGTTALSGGTLHMGVSTGSTTGSIAGPLNLTGGTFRSNRTDAQTPIGGAFTATAGNIEVNKASGIFTLNATNLPAGGSNVFTTLTGANGATFVVDAAPTASLRFGTASNATGLNVVLKSGNITFNTSGGVTNLRIEGGSFTANATDRFTLATANQTFTVTGGTVNLTAGVTYGFRLGGANSANQIGAQKVTATQSGGALTATTFNMGGTDTDATKTPSYSLSGGSFTLTNTSTTAFQLGADTAGTGSATFTLSGSGKLKVPGTVSGAQSGAKQVFAFTSGTLTAAAIDATNLRPDTASANGTLVQSGGTLAPGDTGIAGRTQITGGYNLGASGTLAIDLGGTTQASGFQTGQYDYLTISGATALAGNLSVKLINNFTPSGQFTILNSTGTLTGAFGNVAFGSRVLTAGGEGTFLVTQSGNTVVLSEYQSALTPLQSWRQQYFGTTDNSGTAADNFDADFDGQQNLIEYALGTIPTSSASAARPALGTDAIHLTLTFNRIADPALIYQVEASYSFAPDSWSPIWQSTGAQNSPGPVTVVDGGHEVNNGVPPRRFLRMRVVSP